MNNIRGKNSSVAPARPGVSKFKGLQFSKSSQKWIVRLWKNGRYYYGGTYGNVRVAQDAFNYIICQFDKSKDSKSSSGAANGVVNQAVHTFPLNAFMEDGTVESGVSIKLALIKRVTAGVSKYRHVVYYNHRCPWKTRFHSKDVLYGVGYQKTKKAVFEATQNRLRYVESLEKKREEHKKARAASSNSTAVFPSNGVAHNVTPQYTGPTRKVMIANDLIEYDPAGLVLNAKGTGSSKYKGVSYHKASRTWQTGVCFKGKRHFGGWYKTEEEAAVAYLKLAEDLHTGRTPYTQPSKGEAGEAARVKRTRKKRTGFSRPVKQPRKRKNQEDGLPEQDPLHSTLAVVPYAESKADGRTEASSSTFPPHPKKKALKAYKLASATTAAAPQLLPPAPPAEVAASKRKNFRKGGSRRGLEAPKRAGAILPRGGGGGEGGPGGMKDLNMGGGGRSYSRSPQGSEGYTSQGLTGSGSDEAMALEPPPPVFFPPEHQRKAIVKSLQEVERDATAAAAALAAAAAATKQHSQPRPRKVYTPEYDQKGKLKLVMSHKPTSSSQYKGVTYHKASKQWIAQVGWKGRIVCGGYFKRELEAAAAYAKLLHDLRSAEAEGNDRDLEIAGFLAALPGVTISAAPPPRGGPSNSLGNKHHSMVSRQKPVLFDPESGKWKAQVWWKGKLHSGGLHDTEEAAFKAHRETRAKLVYALQQAESEQKMLMNEAAEDSGDCSDDQLVESGDESDESEEGSRGGGARGGCWDGRAKQKRRKLTSVAGPGAQQQRQQIKQRKMARAIVPVEECEPPSSLPRTSQDSEGTAPGGSSKMRGNTQHGAGTPLAAQPVQRYRDVSSLIVSDKVGGSSKYKGVSFDSIHKRWRVQIWWKGKTHNGGWYDSEEDAAVAYSKLSIKLRNPDGDQDSATTSAMNATSVSWAGGRKMAGGGRDPMADGGAMEDFLPSSSRIDGVVSNISRKIHENTANASASKSASSGLCLDRDVDLKKSQNKQSKPTGNLVLILPPKKANKEAKVEGTTECSDGMSEETIDECDDNAMTNERKDEVTQGQEVNEVKDKEFRSATSSSALKTDLQSLFILSSHKNMSNSAADT